MRRHICTIVLLVVSFSCGAENLKSVLKELDGLIDVRSEYIAKAELKLDTLKSILEVVQTPRERYFYMDRIEEEYRFFNLDSCFAYIGHKKELAHIIGDESHICGYNLNYADIYIKSGYFREAQEILDRFEGKIPDDLTEYYLNIMKTFYEFQWESAKLPMDKEYYREKLAENREERLDYFEGISYVITRIEKMIAEGYYDSAESYLVEIVENAENHIRSQFFYQLAQIYEYKGQEEQRMYYLALSAINDIKKGIRDYTALTQLAIALYGKGELGRADTYLTAAMEDAALCYARPRYLESLEFFTSIDNAYNDRIQGKNNLIVLALAIISLLAIGLGFLVGQLRKYNQNIYTAKENLQLAYNNMSLINGQLKDATVIKDKYIGMYMDQCSAYLTKLDDYRKSLRKMFKLGNMDKLDKTISSEDFIKKEVKEFYANFDQAFLNLYPTFIEEMNKLLKEEEQISYSSGKLNTDLRVYALIRLGIDDSAEIAHFLRHSPQTIYNCRTQMRNKAKGDRDTFEERVKKIGIS